MYNVSGREFTLEQNSRKKAKQFLTESAFFVA
jgi:hypothetical protein